MYVKYESPLRIIFEGTAGLSYAKATVMSYMEFIAAMNALAVLDDEFTQREAAHPCSVHFV